jgi:hypothetical protein
MPRPVAASSVGALDKGLAIAAALLALAMAVRVFLL